MNLKGNAAPEARGAKPFQHSNIYYDTFFSQNAAVAIFQKGLSQKCGNFLLNVEKKLKMWEMWDHWAPCVLYVGVIWTNNH